MYVIIILSSNYLSHHNTQELLRVLIILKSYYVSYSNSEKLFHTQGYTSCLYLQEGLSGCVYHDVVVYSQVFSLASSFSLHLIKSLARQWVQLFILYIVFLLRGLWWYVSRQVGWSLPQWLTGQEQRNSPLWREDTRTLV